MILQFWEQLNRIIGTGKPAQELTLTAITLRAAMMFLCVLLMLRISNKRFLARRNALDTLLGFLLASMLARAINGSERFFETVAAGFVVVLLHRGLSFLAFHSHLVGKWLKGEPETVVENGEIERQVMARLHISDHDLLEDLRLKTGSDELNNVERARIERNGELSIKRKEN